MQIKGSNRIFNFRMVISGKYIDYMIFAVKIKVVEHVTSLLFFSLKKYINSICFCYITMQKFICQHFRRILAGCKWNQRQDFPGISVNYILNSC